MIYCASDLHIGYENTRYDKINEFLDVVENKASELILVGDTFDLWRSNWLQILSKHKDIIVKIADISLNIPVIIIRGNHDYNLSLEFFKNIKHNINIVNKLEFDDKIFIHGWQFDLLQRFGSIFYKQIFEYFPFLYQIFFRKPSEILSINDYESELVKKIRKETIEFSNKNNKIIIMGHTHVPLISDKIIDCGDFVDSCSYITIGDVPKIHYL